MLKPGGTEQTDFEPSMKSLSQAAPSPGLPDDFSGGSLMGRDLRGANLVGRDLSGLDLSGADLSSAKLIGTNLQGTKLFEAKLCKAEFLRANLAGADLSKCDADGAGFGKANLRGAILFGADLRGATLTQSCLVNADVRAAALNKARLRETDLRGADLSRADLQDADLSQARVEGAQFVDSDLRRSRLHGIHGHAEANWVGADVRETDFGGAYLARRVMADQNYLYEFRNQNRISKVVYWIWWATSDCGRSLSRWAAWIGFIVLGFAGLFPMVEVDWGDHPTWLSPIYYSVVTFTTLGYGDVAPVSVAAQIVAMSEVFLGYVMLGGLLSIFANKMARRAD